MENAIIIAVLVIILGLAGFYIYRAKKSGKKCIGCPAGGSCSSQKNGGCGCGFGEQ
ncbi:MAG: FeoB-associated Cys-rich membrane protein [Clostridia bacterium]|nr:FeoB-associated Cys-rich membrane protein [Clostridia bacterium]